jgi:hypothetical protein
MRISFTCLRKYFKNIKMGYISLGSLLSSPTNLQIIRKPQKRFEFESQVFNDSNSVRFVQISASASLIANSCELYFQALENSGFEVAGWSGWGRSTSKTHSASFLACFALPFEPPSRGVSRDSSEFPFPSSNNYLQLLVTSNSSSSS